MLSLLVSQNSPLKPDSQMHLNPSEFISDIGMQTPLLRHFEWRQAETSPWIMRFRVSTSRLDEMLTSAVILRPLATLKFNRGLFLLDKKTRSKFYYYCSQTY